MDGNILEEYTPSQQEVLPRNTALTVSNVLSDNQARIPTFGANSSLYIPGYDVAAKTGTTNNNKDAWLIGYSPSIAVGVWAGNNDNKAMKKGGSALAGPIWNNFMRFALSTRPNEKFEDPDLYQNPQTVKPVLRGNWQGNVSFFIDKISGGLATEYTPAETQEEKVVTDVHTILHWVEKNDINGPAPSNPEKNSQYSHWEIPVQKWWSENSYKYPIITLASQPNYYDTIHNQNTGAFQILEPSPLEYYNSDQKVVVTVGGQAQFPVRKIDVFVNNIYVGSSNGAVFSFIPNDLENMSNQNTLKVIVHDTAYNSTELNSVLNIK